MTRKQLRLTSENHRTNPRLGRHARVRKIEQTPENKSSISLYRLEMLAEMWLDYGSIKQHTATTQEIRRIAIRRLTGYMKENQLDSCGHMELSGFFSSLTNRNESRNSQRENIAISARSVATYHNHLRTFFRWLADEGELDADVIERIPLPIARNDEIQPLSNEQVSLMIEACRRSAFPRHNEAIIRFLIDTGVRASEACGISMGDLDMRGRSVTVLGKGNKRRTAHFGTSTSRVLWAYMRSRDYVPGEDDNDPLFAAQHGPNKGGRLTANGLLQLVQRIGAAAGITGVRCSPHTLRHTFAVNFIRNGGNPFSLMRLLGHTDLQMTNRYVTLAAADIAEQHRKFSPIDNMGF